jgi:two-component system, OmpR family, response regulator VanR
MNTNLLLLKNKSVLFVEDDQIMKMQITKVLEMLFQKVFCAEDGESAYLLYKEKSPDIIISDIKMPRMNGLELIEKIRQTDYKIPVILLTSFTEKKILLGVVNLSIDGYIIKPVELTTLIVTISKAMQRTERIEGLVPITQNIFYNSGTQELYQNGEVVPLGVNELEFIRLLIKNRGITVSKEDISAKLWPLESRNDSSIKSLILRIRRKLDTDIIVSVRGIGYRLVLSE